MKIVYTDHARARMKQRGITELEVELVLDKPNYVRKSFRGRFEALGEVKNREIKVEFEEVRNHIENYIKVITIM